MKRRELIKKFTDKGCYTDGVNTEMIPRHPDVKEKLARGLIKKWGL